jgi:hypothetical protein
MMESFVMERRTEKGRLNMKMAVFTKVCLLTTISKAKANYTVKTIIGKVHGKMGTFKGKEDR